MLELRQHTKGICPACKKGWPATPEQMREKSASKEVAKQVDDELPIKIGDSTEKVIAVLGEPPRMGRPSMGVMNPHQKELYSLVDFPYRIKGIRLGFYRDRVWKVVAESRYKGTLMGIHIGDGSEVIIDKYKGQLRYRGESRLEYDLLGNRQVTFNLDKATKTVTRITVCDSHVYDRFSKKARRLYLRGMWD